MSARKTLLICLAILLAGAAITAFIFSTEPTAQRAGATRQTAMLVDVTTVERGTFRPTVEAMGTVVPSRDIVLSPRVSGEIVELDPAFTPGGDVQKGELLLRIDPADYENALQQRRSELRQAVSDLEIEKGRRDVARQDLELLDQTLSGENEALVLREPQIQAARSRVESARAAVEQAKLNLDRTTIEAPFDAHILTRNANVGSQVAPGDDLGRLVGLDTYWVEATVPVSKLRWLTFPDGGQERGSPVRIRNRTAWQQGQTREGWLYKLVGALEDRTRMARVLVSVPDPLALETDDPEDPPLIIGSYVQANIEAKELTDVIRLERDHVRQDDTVWIMEEGELRIRKPEIAFRDARYAYILGGLAEDARVVTTNLTTVVDGAPLRIEGSAAEAGRGSEDAPAQESGDGR